MAVKPGPLETPQILIDCSGMKEECLEEYVESGQTKEWVAQEAWYRRTEASNQSKTTEQGGRNRDS